MSDKTGIEWTDATWNPVTGCDEVSPGCDHCYAKTFAERWRGTPGHYFEQGFDVQLRPDKLGLPLRWTKPRRIFVNSMSDLFHDEIPDEYIAKVFAVMALASQHTFQILTKRHGRMRSLLRSPEWIVLAGRAIFELNGSLWPHQLDPHGAGFLPLPNVWLGVSVEDQKWADIRVPALLMTPAAVRFLSCEPLLGPIDLAPPLRRWADGEAVQINEHLHWVIVGGESGRGARPMHPDWARSLRGQCVATGVAFSFKQWGEWAPTSLSGVGVLGDRECYVGSEDGDGFRDVMRRVGKKAAGRELDGRTWDEYPEVAS